MDVRAVGAPTRTTGSRAGPLGPENDRLRIDEENEGAIDIELTRVRAAGNDGQSLQMTENGGGDSIA